MSVACVWWEERPGWVQRRDWLLQARGRHQPLQLTSEGNITTSQHHNITTAQLLWVDDEAPLLTVQQEIAHLGCMEADQRTTFRLVRSVVNIKNIFRGRRKARRRDDYDPEQV